MPLLITDDGGNLLYKSRALGKDAATLTTLADAGQTGIVKSGTHCMYVREITLNGTLYRFYMDFDRLTSCYGVSAAAHAADGLFDVAQLAAAPKTEVSLQTLAHWFAESYGNDLRAGGIKLEIRHLAQKQVIRVRPNAAMLCIALIVRLCACRGETVRLSAVRDNGCVTIFADTEIGNSKKDAPEVLRMLLYEVAGAAGFAVEHTEKNGSCAWWLCLAPPDIGAYGLKVPLPIGYKKNCIMYTEMFL